jgi:hypothetical protein
MAKIVRDAFVFQKACCRLGIDSHTANRIGCLLQNVTL